jgi:ACR3 family arsenite efflux pump ArsB
LTGKLVLKKHELQILIPPIVGLLAAYLPDALFGLGLDKFYYSFDPDFGSGFSRYASIYILLFIPLLVVGVVFQYFIAIKIWNRYMENKKILKLSLWQLICISCLIFILLLSAYQFQNLFSENFFIVIFTRHILFVTVYWFTNYYAMKVIR